MSDCWKNLKKKNKPKTKQLKKTLHSMLNGLFYNHRMLSLNGTCFRKKLTSNTNYYALKTNDECSSLGQQRVCFSSKANICFFQTGSCKNNNYNDNKINKNTMP